MSKQAALVLEQLEKDLRDRPGDFSEDTHTIMDKKGPQFWIASGFLFYRCYKPTSLGFSFMQKIRFSIMLKKWRAERMITAATG